MIASTDSSSARTLWPTEWTLKLHDRFYRPELCSDLLGQQSGRRIVCRMKVWAQAFPAAAVADGAVMTSTCEDNLRRCMLRSLKDATDLSRGLPLMICSRARLGFALHTFGPAQCGLGLANTQGGGSDGYLWNLEVRPFWPRRASRQGEKTRKSACCRAVRPACPGQLCGCLGASLGSHR